MHVSYFSRDEDGQRPEDDMPDHRHFEPMPGVLGQELRKQGRKLQLS